MFSFFVSTAFPFCNEVKRKMEQVELNLQHVACNPIASSALDIHRFDTAKEKEEEMLAKILLGVKCCLNLTECPVRQGILLHP
jgi:hypothetical protein